MTRISAAQGISLFIGGLLQRMGSVNRRMRFVEDTVRIGAIELMHLLALILPLGGLLTMLGHVSLGDQFNVFSTPLDAGLQLMEFGFLVSCPAAPLNAKGAEWVSPSTPVRGWMRTRCYTRQKATGNCHWRAQE